MKNMKHPRCLCGLRIRGSVVAHESGEAHLNELAKDAQAVLDKQQEPWRGIHC